MSVFRDSNVYVNPDLEGYLLEKKFMKNVKTWCSLQGPTLYLQKTQGGAIQTIDMASEVQHVKPLEGHTTFEISHKSSKHIFICANPGECASWITALLKAMALKSNGVGQSRFAQSLTTQDENPYALASDDVMSGNSCAQSGTEYEDIGNFSETASNLTKQRTGNSKEDNSEVAPALPPMDARLAKRQQSQEEVYYGDAQSAAVKERSCQEEVYYTEGVSNNDTCQQEVYYSEGISAANSSADKVVSPNAEEVKSSDADVYETISNAQSEAQGSKVEMRAEESDGSGVKTEVHGEGDDDSSVVMRRSQAFVGQENGSSTPEIIIEDSIEEDPEFSSAFAQLDQALTCQDYTDIDLQYPLTASDYQPIMELQEFLANNQQLSKDSPFDQRLLFSDEDPVAKLKLYISQLSL